MMMSNTRRAGFCTPTEQILSVRGLELMVVSFSAAAGGRDTKQAD
jgi:hypothetical protein